ncbi:hypothetical protein [Larkinella rosea]|uniref:T9SS C-terminal target domain-containing protein n=1 Tax=Larkinella rosea TaxID=2025312 RepID=A0A3P1BLY7_9BACT|nr:hypothetical protein [Larkinella rosea]RRB02025.1 hypothetical protein EHT25_16145 [Larkinella rosea]
MKKQLRIVLIFLATLSLSYYSQAQVIDVYATPTDIVSDQNNSVFLGTGHTGVVNVTVGNNNTPPIPAGQMSVVITLNQYVNYVSPASIPGFAVVPGNTSATSVYLINTIPIDENASPIVLSINVVAVQQVANTTITSTASLVEPTDLSENNALNNTSNRETSVGASPLPVTISSFTVKAANKHAVLEWATSSEKNNAFFEVQHSTNARDFDVLGKVAGHGTTFETHQYRFLQEYPDQSTVHYYRLRQVDTDGKYEFSTIRSLTFDGYVGIELKLSTNPVTNGVVKAYVDYGDVNLANQASLNLIDNAGRVVSRQDVLLEKGRNTVQFPGVSLHTGIYVITLQNASLTQPRLVKVAVQ